MNDTDDEIEMLLKDITIKEIRTFKEINETNSDIIDDIYSDFLKYTINIENKKNLTRYLKNSYELIDIREALPNMWISYIDLSKFYNLKIHCRGLFIKFKSDKTIQIKLNHRFYNVNINNKIFFKKLNNKDLLKIHLIESIN
tara:strand:+ start:205 stop:630 length:426 start_codon:yes stop_codon:yes gene_type:complete